MGKDTNIEWADHTFNPWIGCAKVSPGCKNCYAEILMDTRYGRVEWGVNGTRVKTSPNYWKKPLAWAKEARRAGVKRRVFCASLADVFEDRPELVAWRFELFSLILQTPELDWLILTKRPENYEKVMADLYNYTLKELGAPTAFRYSQLYEKLENVWYGVSVENQEQAEKRIPALLKMPAKRHFLSCEPLLEKVDLFSANHGLLENTVDWVIVGGESGKNARPMHPHWVMSMRDQCEFYGVKFFFKQWGEWVPEHQVKDWYKYDVHEWNTAIASVRVGKKKAGRLLDGRTWDLMPPVELLTRDYLYK